MYSRFLHVRLNCRSEFCVFIQKVTGYDVGMLSVNRITTRLTSIIQNMHLMLLWLCLRMFWKECTTSQNLKSVMLDRSHNETVVSVEVRAVFALNLNCSQHCILKIILCVCFTSLCPFVRKQGGKDTRIIWSS
jgi:hypothetical protein